jgi:hypothetical protein
MEKTMRLEYSSALSDIISLNDSFDGGVLRIAYTGKNRNNSFISKQVFENAIPSMFNCPVVANYMRDDDEIGSHDSELIEKDGNIKLVNITQPIGVVPESANWSWETIEDDSGIHQYLCADVVLWKRQEAYAKIKENGITKQSMEISVTDGEMTDDCYKINDFYFTAFCLLGTAEPCFESAALLTFSADDFKSQYTAMMQELKNTFSSVNISEKEDGKVLKLSELLEKYSCSESDLNFNPKDMSDEELEKSFKAQFENAGGDNNDPPSPGADPSTKPSNPEDNYALNRNLNDELFKTVRSLEIVKGEYYEFPRYFMIEFDAELSEVYFEDALNNYNLYGAPYSVAGDSIIIDIANAKRKKFAIVDYVDGSLTQFSAIKDITECANEQFHILNEELTSLREFKETTIKTEEENKMADLFTKFDEKLSGDETFEALKSDHSNYTSQSLETELYALVGKLGFNSQTNFAKVGGIDVKLSKKLSTPYGNLFDGIVTDN